MRASMSWREAAANDRTKKANELVRGSCGSDNERRRDIVVASDSSSNLWRDLSLEQTIQIWNMTHVDIATSPGSALGVFSSSERLANQLKINEIVEVGKLVEKNGMGAPKAGTLMKKVRDG